jgi:PPOX class probable F420-dependent enzyme
MRCEVGEKMIDLRTEFGQRVQRRLEAERIAWLTTVSNSQTPQPRPIWFLWDGQSFLIYSRPNTYKLRHLESNPRVSLHLDGDGLGGDIVVLIGQAEIDQLAPPADEVEDYVVKYQPGFERLGMSADEFADIYSVAIRVKPLSLRGH